MKLIVNLFVRNPKKTEKFVLKCAAEKKICKVCPDFLKKLPPIIEKNAKILKFLVKILLDNHYSQKVIF